MAETYRKTKIEAYYHRLGVRIKAVRSQLNQSDLSDKHDFLQGQLTALELVMEELDAEFSLADTKETEEST
jgi:hypothetical protein